MNILQMHKMGGSVSDSKHMSWGSKWTKSQVQASIVFSVHKCICLYETNLLCVNVFLRPLHFKSIENAMDVVPWYDACIVCTKS